MTGLDVSELSRALSELEELEEKARTLRGRRGHEVRVLLAHGHSAAEIGRALDVSGERVGQWARAGS